MLLRKQRWHKAARVLALFALALLLLLLGEERLPPYQWLSAVSQVIAAPWGASGELKHDSLFFRMVYVSVCLLIIQLFFCNSSKTKVAAGFYLVTLPLILVLIMLGKRGEDWEMLLHVGRGIKDMIISPMPVILMISAFYLWREEAVSSAVK